MAARMAAGRYARPVIFLSERPSALRAGLLRVGKDLASQGHDILIADDPDDVFAGTQGTFVRAASGSSVHLLLIPEVHGLNQRVLSKVLDALHLVARDGLSAGCLATGSPDTPRILGGLRSFAERLFEYKGVSS